MRNRTLWLLVILSFGALAALTVLAAILLLRPSAPPPPVSLSPAPSIPPSLTPGTPSPRPTPDSTSILPRPTLTPPHKPTSTLEPTPTFYVTLYPYSLDSLEGWSVYTDTQLKIAFPYPAQPPRIYYIERKQVTGFAIQAQWDSMNPRAHASISIHIWENPDDLPLDAAIAEIARKKGTKEYWRIAPPDPGLVESLIRAGAEDAAAYMLPPVPVYVASYQKRVYVFGGGFESESLAQDKILSLIVQNVRFLP